MKSISVLAHIIIMYKITINSQSETKQFEEKNGVIGFLIKSELKMLQIKFLNTQCQKNTVNRI